MVPLPRRWRAFPTFTLVAVHAAPVLLPPCCHFVRDVGIPVVFLTYAACCALALPAVHHPTACPFWRYGLGPLLGCLARAALRGGVPPAEGADTTVNTHTAGAVWKPGSRACSVTCRSCSPCLPACLPRTTAPVPYAPATAHTYVGGSASITRITPPRRVCYTVPTTLAPHALRSRLLRALRTRLPARLTLRTRALPPHHLHTPRCTHTALPARVYAACLLTARWALRAAGTASHTYLRTFPRFCTLVNLPGCPSTVWLRLPVPAPHHVYPPAMSPRGDDHTYMPVPATYLVLPPATPPQFFATFYARRQATRFPSPAHHHPVLVRCVAGPGAFPPRLSTHPPAFYRSQGLFPLELIRGGRAALQPAFTVATFSPRYVRTRLPEPRPRPQTPPPTTGSAAHGRHTAHAARHAAQRYCACAATRRCVAELAFGPYNLPFSCAAVLHYPAGYLRFLRTRSALALVATRTVAYAFRAPRGRTAHALLQVASAYGKRTGGRAFYGTWFATWRFVVVLLPFQPSGVLFIYPSVENIAHKTRPLGSVP